MPSTNGMAFGGLWGRVAVRAAALQRRRILGIQPSIDVPTMVGLLTRRPMTISAFGLDPRSAQGGVSASRGGTCATQRDIRVTCGRIRRAPARVPPTARSQSLVVRWHPSGTRTRSPTIPHDSSAARAHPHAARDHSPSSSPRVTTHPPTSVGSPTPFHRPTRASSRVSSPHPTCDSRTSADRQSATANPQAASGDRQLASRARSSTHAPCHFRRRTLRFPPTPDSRGNTATPPDGMRR